MSRKLIRKGKGFVERLDNPNKCRWLYDDVCCNDSSEWLADFPLDLCKTCRYFTKERVNGKKT